jgi:hypothetical protein
LAPGDVPDLVICVLTTLPSAELGNFAASLMMLTANFSVRASSALAKSLFSIFQL